MRNDKENIIVEKSFQFSLKIVAFCDLLEEKKIHSSPTAFKIVEPL
jgi:hypothetical protein